MAPDGMCGMSGMCDVTRYQGDTKGLLISSIYVNVVLFSAHKGVMTSNDVREKCYIIVMTGRCVNKPDQTEPVSCYEKTFISKFAQVCK